MAINPDYVLGPSLQELFVDKDTGLPLVGGKVWFWEDNARTIPKPVFEISGSPPNYSYTVLPNPLTLGPAGSFVDGSNNDILPYYYPFDVDGNPQLYFIQIYNADGVLQFTRQGWPNFSVSDVQTDNDVTNFVPNGQFLLHNNIPAQSANGYVAGKVFATTTLIAEGGWSYVRTSNSPVDFITYDRFTNSNPGYTGNPPYALRFQCSTATAETQKDITLTFPGVNTFASSSQPFNFYFEGQSLSGSSITNIQLLVIKNFGTGGSPSATTTTTVTSITLLANAVTIYNNAITFGTNDGKVFGTNNDDSVSIVLRFPPNTTFAAQLSNAAITINSERLSAFPTQTASQQLAASTAGSQSVPSYNGFDLYLPLIVTPNGLEADHSRIGNFEFLSYAVANPKTQLLADGTGYITADYSSVGVPYARLQSVLFDSTTSSPIYGTGADFVISAVLSDNSVLIATNKTGSTTAISAGTTTFTVKTISTGFSSATLGFRSGTNVVTGRNNAAGSVTAASAGTSGFTVVNSEENNSVVRNSFTVTIGALPAAGTYFLFSSTAVNYYVWFKINGVGVDPAVGGRTGILVDLTNTMSTADAAICVSQAISGRQVSTVIPGNGASITAGQFFSFFTSTPAQFNPWFTVDTSGSVPVQPGTEIQTDILSTDTALQVAQKIRTAINMYSFSVPDYRGLFPRGWSNGSGIDPNATARFGQSNFLIFGDLMGTMQLDIFTSHTHPIPGDNDSTNSSYVTISSTTQGTSRPTLNSGGAETRGINAYVNWAINY